LDSRICNEQLEVAFLPLTPDHPSPVTPHPSPGNEGLKA